MKTSLAFLIGFAVASHVVYRMGVERGRLQEAETQRLADARRFQWIERECMQALVEHVDGDEPGYWNLTCTSETNEDPITRSFEGSRVVGIHRWDVSGTVDWPSKKVSCSVIKVTSDEGANRESTGNASP